MTRYVDLWPRDEALCPEPIYHIHEAQWRIAARRGADALTMRKLFGKAIDQLMSRKVDWPSYTAEDVEEEAHRLLRMLDPALRRIRSPLA